MSFKKFTEEEAFNMSSAVRREHVKSAIMDNPRLLDMSFIGEPDCKSPGCIAGFTHAIFPHVPAIVGPVSDFLELDDSYFETTYWPQHLADAYKANYTNPVAVASLTCEAIDRCAQIYEREQEYERKDA